MPKKLAILGAKFCEFRYKILLCLILQIPTKLIFMPILELEVFSINAKIIMLYIWRNKLLKYEYYVQNNFSEKNEFLSLMAYGNSNKYRIFNQCFCKTSGTDENILCIAFILSNMFNFVKTVGMPQI